MVKRVDLTEVFTDCFGLDSKMSRWGYNEEASRWIDIHVGKKTYGSPVTNTEELK